MNAFNVGDQCWWDGLLPENPPESPSGKVRESYRQIVAISSVSDGDPKTYGFSAFIHDEQSPDERDFDGCLAEDLELISVALPPGEPTVRLMLPRKVAEELLVSLTMNRPLGSLREQLEQLLSAISG